MQNKELSERCRKFIAAYLKSYGRQGEAARTAGYAASSSDVVASRLLKDIDVDEAIRTLMGSIAKDIGYPVLDVFEIANKDAVPLRLMTPMIMYLVDVYGKKETTTNSKTE